MESLFRFAEDQGLSMLARDWSLSPQGGAADTTPWTTITWGQYYDQIMTFAKSLLSINFEAHHAINIIGFNSPEWVVANLGAIAAGGVAVGIYTTNNVEACKYITEHSEAEVVVVENKKQLEKFLQISHELPKLKVGVARPGHAWRHSVLTGHMYRPLLSGTGMETGLWPVCLSIPGRTS
jgi:long-subunit acyl-CoA synthetase (AMP-forming)